MRKSMSGLRLKARCLFGAVLLALAVAAISPPSALAAPGDPATIYAGLFHLPGNPPNTPPKCGPTKRIQLGAGTYRWVSGTEFSGDPWLRIDRTLRLGAASYDWKVCIDPNQGHYVMYAELDPSYGPWRTVRVVSRGFPLTTGDYWLYSRLDPITLDK